MSDYLIYDSSFAEDYVRFTYISDRRFNIDSVTGDIKIQSKLDPLHLHYVIVYLRYNGTVKSTKRLYSATTNVLILIYSKGMYVSGASLYIQDSFIFYSESSTTELRIYDPQTAQISCKCLYLLSYAGCFEFENGNVVWPASHVCTTVKHNCKDADPAFNDDGVVTRYCSVNGSWFDADYSQCTFKPGTKPFVHLYFTFYTGSESYILRSMQGIIRSVSPDHTNPFCSYFYQQTG